MRMKTPKNWTKHDSTAADVGGLIVKVIFLLALLIILIK